MDKLKYFLLGLLTGALACFFELVRQRNKNKITTIEEYKVLFFPEDDFCDDSLLEYPEFNESSFYNTDDEITKEIDVE